MQEICGGMESWGYTTRRGRRRVSFLREGDGKAQKTARSRVYARQNICGDTLKDEQGQHSERIATLYRLRNVKMGYATHLYSSPQWENGKGSARLAWPKGSDEGAVIFLWSKYEPGMTGERKIEDRHLLRGRTVEFQSQSAVNLIDLSAAPGLLLRASAWQGNVWAFDKNEAVLPCGPDGDRLQRPPGEMASRLTTIVPSKSGDCRNTLASLRNFFQLSLIFVRHY
ncbi:hypothetical protein B0H16DRAFT_1471063 [Mycena metata]|uniref:Uncharacterized protein n=1 Tax=Mycena metata TaxID=1033252 RepID=A0AAD7MQB0_9AGAR|nr:hypothetical protein B0H16DRAFT_1471063 [Mycena metata]